MFEDELINYLARLNINDGRIIQSGKSSTPTAPNNKGKGEDALQQLRLHLARARSHASRAISSPPELRKMAKQHCRGLFKIAQAGLRNRAGGSEPLHLACEAMHTLLPLYSLAGAADLVMEKLWYQAIARCVDLGEFSLGLRATASLQVCLNKRHGYADGGATSYSEGVECYLTLQDAGGDTLRLYPFPPPAGNSLLDVATLVSGASLNVCRCCLEVGSKEALLVVAGELGRSSWMWIDRVCSLGESAKAEAHRDHLFKLLWRACSALEKASLGATAQQCLVGRQTALKVLLRKGDSWSVDKFVAHAHRGAVALESFADDCANADVAAQLSAFCLEALKYREGGDWPAGTGQAGDMQSTWVDWLQHSAGLLEKTGDREEAQRLLQIAYEYVRRCWRRGVENKQDSRASACCAAYASILKVHAAATITAQHPLLPSDRSSITAESLTAARHSCTIKRIGKGADASPSPSSAVARGHIVKALEYIGDVCDALEAEAESEEDRAEEVEEAAVFVGTALKAWKWTQKACGVTASWAEQARGGRDGIPYGTEAVQWSELNARGHVAVGDLSRALAACSRGGRGRVFERMPRACSISELAVDFYLRAANLHLVAWTQANQSALDLNAQTVRRCSEDSAAGESAREALMSAEEMCKVEASTLTPQQTKKAGAGWFALGTSLIGCSEINAGLAALVKGCRLLEVWTDVEVSRGGESPDVVQIFRSAQLDLRLSKLCRVLQDSAEFGAAASVAARALAFCPDLWCMSYDGRVESPAGALALVEKYVACYLRCRRPEIPESRDGVRQRESSSAKEAVTADSVRTLVAYLYDGDDSAPESSTSRIVSQSVSTILERKGCPPYAIAWALLAECQAYRTHLRLYASPGYSAGEDYCTLSKCVEGHRRSTKALLKTFASREGKQDHDETVLAQAGTWQVLARVVAARLEHDLFLVNVGARGDAQNTNSVADNTMLVADLPEGLFHASSGVEEASKVGEKHNCSVMAGVCWCIRALLFRDMRQNGGDTERAMREGLDLLVQTVRNPDWTPEGSWQAALGSGGAASIVTLLEVLENHFALYGDTLRRVKAAEIKGVISDRATLADEAKILPRDAAASAVALSSIGRAYHAAGVPGLTSIYHAAAREKNIGVRNGHGERALIGVDVLRRLCLAELSSYTSEAEETLLEARRVLSDLDSGLVAPATAAFLECAVGMDLSWIYEGMGRLAEAVDEIRKVMRLCHAWASADGPDSLPDRQVVVLSAVKGASVHDEESCEQGTAEKKAQAEEGLGEEDGGIEEIMSNVRVGENGRDRKESALSSRWIPIYLEGLARLGRLWRARGFASKASGYLRQGCVTSESLGATIVLRHCLLEEVEVAMGMHRFDRADRLLQASKDLLEQERRELCVGKDGAASASCETCAAMDNAVTPMIVQPVTVKGNGPRRRARKGGNKPRVPPGPPTSPSSVRGPCVRCRESALSAAEFAVTEACLLRKKGNFAGALTACKRGQAILTPLIHAASSPPRVGSPLSLTVPTESGVAQRNGGQGQGPGWRAVRVISMLNLQRGRAESLLGNLTAAREFFHECARMNDAPALVVASALYRLGCMQLDGGDMAGALQSLGKARELTSGAGAPKLVRNVRRVLAVALTVASAERGRREYVENISIDGTWEVAALASLSIGVTHCNQVVHAAARRARKGEMMQHTTGNSAGLQLFDVVSRGYGSVGDSRIGGRKGSNGPTNKSGGEGHCLQEAIESGLRAEWPIVTLCLVPGNSGAEHFLLTRLARGRPPLTVSVPLSPEDVELLDRWRDIMEKNNGSLRGHSAEEAAGWGNSQKADWWKRRNAVDEAMDLLLRELEEKWFGAHGLSAILVGEVVDERLEMELAGVFEFAKDRISAARSASLAVGPKAGARGKAGKRSRGGASTVRGRLDLGAQEELPSGVSELIRLCVRGGDVMDEEAWIKVIQLSLSKGTSEETVAKISSEIWGAVSAAFVKAKQEECVDRGFGGFSTPVSVKRLPASSLEIERGRSAGLGARVQVAATATSASSSSNISPIDQSDLSTMKVADLRRELASRGIAISGRKLKADLLARLSEVMRQEVEKAAEGDETLDCDSCDGFDDCGVGAEVGMADASDESEVSDLGEGEGGLGENVINRHPVVLVLDEQLQALPWEGLPCLRGNPVTRVPAIPFVFSALEARWDREEEASTPRRSRDNTGKAAVGMEPAWLPSQDGLRLNRGFYVVDPEGNLPHTRQQLGPLFEDIGRRLGWTGVQGSSPAGEDMSRALQEVDMLVYCGHGAGELLVGREEVAGMTRCAAAVLMGCSSGRLKGYGDFEPTGMASSYLVGGSPAVVANLWDVTDKDIDRFSSSLFEAFVGGEDGTRDQAPTLAHAVTAARSQCKMSFIVGYAPVCYGIPLSVAASLRSL